MDDTRIERVAADHTFPGMDKEFDSNGKWAGNFIFIQAADTQFGLIDNWAGNPPETRVWDEEIRLTREAIKRANAMTPQPKFFVVCGDLVDDGPGQQHQAAQQRDFKRLFSELNNNIPLVCVCGNHDVGNEPTPQTLQEYRSRYGDDYFVFWVGSTLFIVLNSQLYYDHSNAVDEYKAHDAWLDEQLKICASGECTHCVMFQHIPWFTSHPEEDDQYFNVPKVQRERMLKKLNDAGVRYVFSGHFHRNAGGKYKNLEMVVTSAIGCQIGDDVSGMRLVRVSEGKIDHKYYGLSEWPEVVDLSEDVNLP